MEIGEGETNARILCKFREVKKLPTLIFQAIFPQEEVGSSVEYSCAASTVYLGHSVRPRIWEQVLWLMEALPGPMFFLVVKEVFGSSYHLVS